MDCVFCRIANGETPATIIASNGESIAFQDLNPQAPVHVLVIPRDHVRSTKDLGARAGTVLASILGLAVETAHALGLDERGYRLVVNTGEDGGQSVDHLHVHLLGGRQMRWPPG